MCRHRDWKDATMSEQQLWRVGCVTAIKLERQRKVEACVRVMVVSPHLQFWVLKFQLFMIGHRLKASHGLFLKKSLKFTVVHHSAQHN